MTKIKSGKVSNKPVMGKFAIKKLRKKLIKKLQLAPNKIHIIDDEMFEQTEMMLKSSDKLDHQLAANILLRGILSEKHRNIIIQKYYIIATFIESKESKHGKK